MLRIEAPAQKNFGQWAILMRKYFDFYQFPVTNEHLEKVFNPSTFNLKECYLSDLYVLPNNLNIGKKLLEVSLIAKKNQCVTIYVLTAINNIKAQKLYDRTLQGQNSNNKTSWLMYTANLE